MKKNIYLLFIGIFFSMQSCLVSKEQFGNYNESDCPTKIVAKGKDIYIFWDKVHIREEKPDTIPVNYEKIVRRNIFDAVVFVGTAGIFSFYTVKIKSKDCKD